MENVIGSSKKCESQSDFAFSASSSTSDLQSRSVNAVESRITRAVDFFMRMYRDGFQ